MKLYLCRLYLIKIMGFIAYAGSVVGAGLAQAISEGNIIAIIVGVAVEGIVLRAGILAGIAIPPFCDFDIDSLLPPSGLFDPTISNLEQYMMDGTTIITAGGTTNETIVVFEADIEDLDTGSNDVFLEIEVQPVETSFGNPLTGITGLSSLSSDGTVQISVGITIIGQYHWRARARDLFSNVSNWAFYGIDDIFEVDFEKI